MIQIPKLLTIIFISVVSIFAQNYDWVRHDSLIKAGYNQLYNVQFTNAEETFSIIEKEYPLHPSGKFFQSMILWWKILVNPNNENNDAILINQLNEVINFCDKILDKNKNNKDAILFKGCAFGLKTELRALRENWLRAVLDGRKALKLISRCYEIDPKNIDLQFAFGLYHYLIDVINERSLVLKPWMYLFEDGNKTRGLRELENVALKGRYARIEARFFLQVFNYMYEHNYKESLKWGKYLLDEFPPNPCFKKYYSLAESANK